ncbi:P-loop containing nucleoside triphosphate hydrolase protein [Whalleya microplaca]|nr:P-loop containing nucleoside triphosphate hydrolase protein [Whalleya microplaca]
MADSNTQGGKAQELDVQASKKTLRVDYIYSQHDKQWHYRKTANIAKKVRLSKYTLVVRRTIRFDGTPQEPVVEIRSQKLRELLLRCFKDCHYEVPHFNPLTLPPDTLFMIIPFLKACQVEEEGKETPDRDILNDINEVVVFVDDHFGDSIIDIDSLHQKGEITHSYLWTLFPPGCEIIQQSDLLGEFQALRMSLGSYKQTMHDTHYKIDARMVNHDGEDLGWGRESIVIPAFEGIRPITSLAAFPLKFHKDESSIRRTLIDRGKQYLKLLKPVCKEYDGMGVEMCHEANQWIEKRFRSTGRVMVDLATFRLNQPNSALLDPEVDVIRREDQFAEEELLFCNHRVLGFSFGTKKWGAFAIPKLRDVIWDDTSIDKLIITDKRHKLIKSLITTHDSDEIGFDDVVQGKGKGLVGLLSGPPGTGKTLTAEVIAEFSRRPLYVVTAGELGTEPQKLDMTLGRIFSTVHKWGCVLLIDEADTFLRRRIDGHVRQNSLVSVFLRRLEYFEGILILTTNRRQDIDEAFKSRMHFAWHYPPLDQHGRLAVWKNFLPDLPHNELETLASKEINGREIKNTVACASLIVKSEQKPLTMDLIKDVMDNLTCTWEESEG